MQDLVLIGAGGAACTMIDAIEEINRLEPRWRTVGIIDDNPSKHGAEHYCGVRVIGGREAIGALDLATTSFVIAFSSPATFLGRLAYAESLRRDWPELRFATVIHPGAAISPTARIGEGSFIGRGVVMDSGAAVGNHAIVLFHTVLGRFVTVGEGSFLSATVNVTAGHSIGAACYVGANATIHADIGDRVLAGAGAVVKKKTAGPAILNTRVEDQLIACETPERMQAMLSRMIG